MGIWSICASSAPPALSQSKAVTAQVKIEAGSTGKGELATADASSVVVWLKPLGVPESTGTEADQAGKSAQVVQKNKAFHPHLTVVRVGSMVDFPNRDPFFHNVFSLFDGKRFDLGLYEAGATNSVRFDHVGVSFLFCNIHPEMSAVIVAVDTPYYGVSDKAGNVAISNVPEGKYELHAWYERSVPEVLKRLTRTVEISGTDRDLGAIVVPQDPGFTPTHKNKYGQDYVPPPKPGYPQP
jgi:plastocyanin